MSDEPRRSFSEGPIGRFVIGVAIIWSIAGAFVALEIGLPALLGRAVQAGAVSDGMVIPGGLSTESPAHCKPGGTPRPDASPAPSVLGEARYLAWRLGEQVGWSAGLANVGRSDEASARSLAELQARAGNMGIPPPLVPPIRHAAKALGEFEAHIESDPQCTAARFSQTYGKPYGSTFKLGAYVGYATVFRMTLPEAAVFAPNIRHHGTGAGVPRELLEPLLQDALDDVPGVETHEKLSTILDRLDEYFHSET